MKTRILVIDDQLRERRAGYERLNGKRFINSLVEIVFAETLDSIPSLLENQYFHAFLVDAVLNSPGYKCELPEIFDLIGNRGPVILVSSRWDSTGWKEARKVQDRKNLLGFLTWKEIDNIESQWNLILFQLLRSFKKWGVLDDTLQVQPDDVLRILHISDLQFGGDVPSLAKLEFESVKNCFRTHWREGPSFVAITGDIAQTGRPEEYAMAKKWVEDLLSDWSDWKFPSRRLLLVPGNHDAMLSLSVADHLELKQNSDKKVMNVVQWTGDDAKIEHKYEAFAFTPFNQFAFAMTGDSTWVQSNQRFWVSKWFRHFGVLFFGCNTAYHFNPKGTPIAGAHPDDLAEIKKDLIKTTRDPGFSNPVVIGLGHHPPLDTSESCKESVDAYESLCRIDSGAGGACSHVPRLLLHGHIHKREFKSLDNNGVRIVTISAPTPTQKEAHREPDTSRGFNMIELARKDGEITEMKCWAYEINRGALSPTTPEMFTRREDGSFFKQT